MTGVEGNYIVKDDPCRELGAEEYEDMRDTVAEWYRWVFGERMGISLMGLTRFDGVGGLTSIIEEER